VLLNIVIVRETKINTMMNEKTSSSSIPSQGEESSRVIQGFDSPPISSSSSSSRDRKTSSHDKVPMIRVQDLISMTGSLDIDGDVSPSATPPVTPSPRPPTTTKGLNIQKSIDVTENFRFYRPFVSTKVSTTTTTRRSSKEGNEDKKTNGSSDLENVTCFSSNHVALSASLLYVDESDVIGEGGDRVDPFEQRSILFEPEKSRGVVHGKRMYLPIRSTREVPHCWNGLKAKKHDMGEVVPWKHGPSFASKWAFPEGASLDMVRLHPPQISITRFSDPLEWRERGHGGVSVHSYLAQHSDAHMTTTYGHVFRWWRPCTSLQIESPDLKSRGGYLFTPPPLDKKISTWRKWSWHSISSSLGGGVSRRHRICGFSFRGDKKHRVSYDLTGARIILSSSSDSKKEKKRKKIRRSSHNERKKNKNQASRQFGLLYWPDSSSKYKVTYFAVPKSSHRRVWVDMIRAEINAAENSIVLEGALI